jgi:hypothetical protein
MLSGCRCDAPFGWISLFGFLNRGGAETQRQLRFLTTEDAEFGTEGTEQGVGEGCLLFTPRPIFVTLKGSARAANCSPDNHFTSVYTNLPFIIIRPTGLLP